MLLANLSHAWQLRGIDKKIAALKTELNYSTSVDRGQFLAGLSNLEIEKARLAQGAMGAHHDSGSVRSGSRSPVNKHEDGGATPPPVGGADCESDSDDASACEADEISASVPSDTAAELIGAGITVTRKELREHFHLPLHTVAKKFGMCTTAFKKLCRRFGIAKWPHRQLRGIDKKIAALKAELNYSTVDKESARRNLLKLQDEKAKLLHGAEWTGLGVDLDGEVRCDSLEQASSRAGGNAACASEQESSSRRVGIRNLLCDEGDGADESGDTKDGVEEAESDDASSVHGDDKMLSEDSGCLVTGGAVTDNILREHFHLPLQQVAKKFGMCTTAFKKLCRRFGIAKWPHRQLRGIDKKIAALKAELNYSTVDKESARRNLATLEEEKARLSRVALGQTSSGPSGGQGQALSQSGVPSPARTISVESQFASRKRKADSHEPEADRSAGRGAAPRAADASALDLLASVAGIGVSASKTHAAPAQRSQADSTSLTPLMPDYSCRLGALHIANLTSSSSCSSSSLSTPSLGPVSPAVSHQAPQLVAPSFGASAIGEGPTGHGARGAAGFLAAHSTPPLDLGLLLSIVGAQT